MTDDQELTEDFSPGLLFPELLTDIRPAFSEKSLETDISKHYAENLWLEGKIPHAHEVLALNAWLRLNEKDKLGTIEQKDAWSYIKLLRWIEYLAEEDILSSNPEREDIPIW